jgi:dTDP-glucose 4,6-dehydratase/UDP-glucuronate decarboxylase
MDMENAQTVVDQDLEYICHRLEKEFAALSGKNILITGGGGFLGYYLIQSLLHWNRTAGEKGVEVTVYDNYVRGLPLWLSSLTGDPNLKLVKHDITRPLPMDIEDFQYIIHAASIASPIYYRKYPIETMDANVNGLRFLLEYCRRQKESDRPVEGFLFYSTSEIYGDPTPENIPTPETYRGNVSCTGPRACYDESKRYGETLCVNFARQYDLPIRIARPFNNYGPGLKITDRRVIPDFVRDILEGRDIIIHPNGSPTCTFCYIADAIVGYFKILIRGRDGEAYNIGVESPEVSVADFADKLISIAGEIFGYRGKVVKRSGSHADYLEDTSNRRCPRIDKAREELEYDPSVSLDEGIRRSLIWYRDNRDAEEA